MTTNLLVRSGELSKFYSNVKYNYVLYALFDIINSSRKIIKCLLFLSVLR